MEQRINESINHTVDEIKLDQLVQESKAMNPTDKCEHRDCNK